jgi:hypothetical protein
MGAGGHWRRRTQVAVDRLGRVLVIFCGFHDLRAQIEPGKPVDPGLQFRNRGSKFLQCMDAGDALGRRLDTGPGATRERHGERLREQVTFAAGLVAAI